MTAVAWQTYGENSINRGYWDQGMLEALLDRRLWRPVQALEFTHYESLQAVPDAEVGAVVIVPARHSAGHVLELNRDLERFTWVVLILTGDEESVFPLNQVTHPNLISWWMSGRPDRQRGTAKRLLGSGWPPQAEALLPQFTEQARERPLDWSFAGQVTHPRRRQCASAIERLLGAGRLVKTESFTSGVRPEEYYEVMASTKVVPCPAGAVSQDSFRLYEALEAGCLPLADGLTSDGEVPRYWEQVLPEVPLPQVSNWAGLPIRLVEDLQHWPGNVNEVFAAWQRYRRRLTYALDSDVREVSGATLGASHHLADLITVILVTSPISLHPSTEIIDETLTSLEAQSALADCERFILFDGVRREQADRQVDYDEYTRRALWDCLHHRRQVVPVLHRQHHHQAAMLRQALDLVRTPLLLFVEHDTPVHGDIDWAGLAEAILSTQANLVRLHHESEILAPHEHMMIDRKPQRLGKRRVPLLRTAQWSQRPHLASVDFYRRILARHFPGDARTMIEDVMHGVVHSAWLDDGVAGWNQFKLWIYAPDGDMKRSWHLDGRAGEDKYPMVLGIEPGSP